DLTAGSDGRRRAARRVRLIARPNEVSTTSAPCSCASRATENAIDESLRTPVTRMRLPASTASTLQRRVGVPTVGSDLALGTDASERGGERTAGVDRGDDIVDVATLGGDVRVREAVLVLGLERGL